MPTNLGRGRPKPRKTILKPEEVAVLLAEARRDPYGLYYGFGFLTGVRPSEQLGLLWRDIDFSQNSISIRRVLERNGELTDATKTAAGTREIPLAGPLRAMLLEWKVRCPRRDGQLCLVFPGPGRLQRWPLPRKGGGQPLAYPNFRRRMWKPVFGRLGLPYCSPHAARHFFVSALQAAGTEVPLVAKLVGHSNPNVTLGVYSQAVRGDQDAVEALAASLLPHD